MIEKRIADNIKIFSFSDTTQLFKRLGNEVSDSLNIGLCIFPGGTTPKPLFEEVSKSSGKIENERALLLSDDRLVENDSEMSNYALINDNLRIHFAKDFPISYFSISQSLGMRGLDNYIGDIIDESPPVTTVLGLGTDVHTASLFPFNKEIDSYRYISHISNENESFERLSLSFYSLMKSQRIVFLVLGKAKRDALKIAISGDYNPEKYPAQRIIRNHKNIEIYCDSSAAGEFL